MNGKGKKKRRANLLGIAVIIFSISLTVYAAVKLVLREYNNMLAVKEQEISAETRELQMANEEISLAVYDMSSTDRVMGITEDSGLNYLQDNIIIIRNDE
ncbi:MAG: hypothetical protein IJ120_08460 [Solobacterium sp.]|nr:hypothetical protein [Solobacterium sp.]